MLATARGRALPYVTLGSAQLAIGAAAIFARYALLGAGPIAVSALRLGIATIAVAIVARGTKRLAPRQEIAFACAGVALAVHFAAWIASLEFTSVAVSTLLVTTTPLWTQAFDSLRERRAPSRTYAVSVLAAIAGVALIAFSRTPGRIPIPGHALWGDALALAGSFAIGAYLLVVRDAGGAGVRRIATREIVLRTYGWAALALVTATLAIGERPPPIENLAAWGGIVAMALVSQLLGHTALNAALRDFSPTVVAMTTLLEPLVAALLAAAIFAETLSLQAVLGGALVLGAIAVVLHRQHVSGDA